MKNEKERKNAHKEEERGGGGGGGGTTMDECNNVTVNI
jgi:hypothetical protein